MQRVKDDNMGVKYSNLQKLYSDKINVHEFILATSISDLEDYASKNDRFSIRFDRDSKYHGLPFYKYVASDYTIEERGKYFNSIVDEANELGCSMLCANGHLYDDIQICNFVIRINEKYDFILEWCTEKVPLREMYQHKTTILKGNVNELIKDMQWENRQHNKIEENEIEEMISWGMKTGYLNKNIEATLYPINVGLLNEKITCWQTD